MYFKNFLDLSYFKELHVLKDNNIFNYTIAVVVVLAILLSIFNEDASTGSLKLSWVLGEFLPIQHTIFAFNTDKEKNKNEQNKNKNKNWIIYTFICFIYNFLLEIKKSIIEKKFLDLMNNIKNNVKKKIKFYTDVVILKLKSESKRHFFFLLLKKKYNVPIKKNENEMQSYLDAKRELIRLNIWAFMLRVSDVKNEYIVCNDKKVRTMSSYSYLDFLREPIVQNYAIEIATKWSTGNHGPRLLGGNSQILVDLEKQVGRFFGRNNSILSVCGFLACMSGIAAVASANDLVLYDSFTHECVKVGIKISNSKSYKFKHNDYGHLEILLLKHRYKYKNCWVCLESVYSMDGDIPYLPAFKKLCVKHNAKLYVDEAHGLGVLGETGRGLEEFYNMPGSIDVIVGTFSKSIGSVGGYIVGSDKLIEFLDIHCMGNVFSAPLPAYCAGGAMKAFELIDEQPWRLKKLKFNIKYLRDALKTGMGYWHEDYPECNKFVLGGNDNTSVIPIIYPNDPDRLFKICKLLHKKGWLVSAVAYPACPLNLPRFRVTGTCEYTIEQMNEFVRDLVLTTMSVEPSPII
ncbi:serine C-palmitoyltransferase, putative [Hepatocystis sp. ex Piliocolobus tephrosceles]|nr:serine C-palmitoyltransferase, putative [Hepatocystis sp. ex Piliocolobus tephrosceles]